jgi:hypothetical protein
MKKEALGLLRCCKREVKVGFGKGGSAALKLPRWLKLNIFS